MKVRLVFELCRYFMLVNILCYVDILCMLYWGVFKICKVSGGRKHKKSVSCLGLIAMGLQQILSLVLL